jgi:Holliday junction resolvasome RuvABC endonuclease subunit
VVTSTTFKPKTLGHERMAQIEDRVAQWCAGAELVVLEGLAYNGPDKMKAMAGNWWNVRHRLWEDGHRVIVVQPTQLKLYVTGRGAASKSAMIEAVNGEDFPYAVVNGDDEADAVGLAHMGARWLGAAIDRREKAASILARWTEERVAAEA